MSTDIPDDVQAVINSDTKATSQERFQKLLRDTYYAGPIRKGESPEKRMGENTSSPGSDLRRSRDGALWGLTQQQENILLQEAVDLGLIGHHNNHYYTTSRGVDVLAVLDRCDRCDECCEQRVPHYEERTVQISRYSSGKNHSLITKCPDCDSGPYNWDRDEFPPTTSTTDDAERISRSIQEADLYDVGEGSWTDPAKRALNDFIAEVADETYDFESFLTRRSTPAYLPGGETALRTVFNDYSAEVCTDFADLLLKTYYGKCLDDVEREIVHHVAAGYPESNSRSTGTRSKTDTHAAEYMEPLAVIDGDSWEATVRFESTGRYVTISGTAEKTNSRVEYDTTNGLSVSIMSSLIGGVYAYPLPDDLSTHDGGDIGTVVAFRVTDGDTFPSESRVELVFEEITRFVDRDSHNTSHRLGKTFKRVVRNKSVDNSRFRRRQTYDLNGTELVKLARKLEGWVHDSDDVPPLVARFASRDLHSAT